MKTEIIRIEWGSLIPALHDAHPSHDEAYDAGVRLAVSGGKVLRQEFYRKDVKPGGGWVTETSLSEIRTAGWQAESRNQIYGLSLTVSGKPDMKFRLMFPWGKIAFTLDQIHRQRFLEWPFGPKYRLLSVRAWNDGVDPMELGFVNDPLPEACPPKPILTLEPQAFHGARCFYRYFDREPAWIGQLQEISASYSWKEAGRKSYLVLYMMLGPPYAKQDARRGRSCRTMRYEVLINGHSLGVTDRYFSFFRSDQKLEEITLEVPPRLVKRGKNHLTIRNHDHCFHLLLVKAEWHEEPLQDALFGVRLPELVLPRGYYTGFDTNVVAPENAAEFKRLLVDISDGQHCNYVLLRPEGSLIHAVDLDEWVRIFTQKGIHFSYLFDEMEGTRRLQEKAGPLFLGHFSHEISHCPHQYASGQIRNENQPTMRTAHENYMRYARWLVRYIKQASPQTQVTVGESQLLAALNYQAGVDRVLPQVNWGVHNGILLAEARGANGTFKKEGFGVHFAGGCLNFPPSLATERLYQVSLHTCYLHGVKHLYDEESALAMIHGIRPYSKHSRFCRGRRALLARYNRFLSQHGDPGTPEVPLAMMTGRYEFPFPTSFPKIGEQKVWQNFGGTDAAWHPSDPEAGWKLLRVLLPGALIPDFPAESEDVRLWHSGTPLGQFDIISSTSPAQSWRKYRTIIFPGWNSMEAPLYRKLLTFVKSGGTLLMTAPQLSTRVDREYLREMAHPEWIFGGEVQELFGVKLLKQGGFAQEVRGDEDNILLPKLIRLSAKINNTRLKLAGAQVLARDQRGQPVLVENRVGKGVARLLTLQAFPGSPGLQPLMAELCKSLATEARGKIWVEDPSTDVAWYLFRKEGHQHLWLLNTDWTTAGNVKNVQIHAGSRLWPVTVLQGEPMCVQID
ncbi:MAG: beta-galactosidase trimerization domain-containing protein [bacterium]